MPKEYADLLKEKIKKSKEYKIITHDEYLKNYKDKSIFDSDWRLARLLSHAIVLTNEGIVRFEENPMARWICDNVNLNKMWCAFHNEKWNLKDMMKFYMNIGYSLCGFSEIFGQCEAEEWDLPNAKKPDRNKDEYTQTPIDWALENF